ncbi:hypothetical protein L5515_001262 [Caenorhabditis briggsae]|uniref:Uncharacterized protein n=1 Tax=Caenorhabditis briggsae TaxID=6238 RepID=A0AAE9E2E7_CAEBR|nr:hypothetical protein L3Y34_015187 [Caenorhabditis briggsae]UMM12531.1 hypothetical protein L5515_001262 [Caenorhabditis briggsae]
MSSHPSHPTNTKTLSPPLPKIHVSLSVGSSGKVNNIRYTKRLENLEVGITITIFDRKRKKLEVYFHRHSRAVIHRCEPGR